MGDNPTPPLLTVKEAALLLKLSPRSIYRKARVLGGFYPLGLRCLRFRAEVIFNAMLAREEGLAVSIPVPGQKIQQSLVSYQGPG